VVESDRQTFVKKVGCSGGRREYQAVEEEVVVVAVVMMMMESSIVGQSEKASTRGPS
jgi:hypothetical protein